MAFEGSLDSKSKALKLASKFMKSSSDGSITAFS